MLIEILKKYFATDHKNPQDIEGGPSDQGNQNLFRQIKLKNPKALRGLSQDPDHPKIAQRLMGHSDIRLTMDIYTEVDTDQLRDAVLNLPTLSEIKRSRLKVVGGGQDS